MQFSYPAAALLGALCLCAGCAKAPVATSSTKTPEQFLKWSMDRYAQLPSYRADANVAMTAGGNSAGAVQTRTIAYDRPNLFKVVTSNAGGFAQTSVCDGKKLVEYASRNGMQAMSYPAPEGIESATSMQMSHPMFCGSLLYQFFGGSANYEALVDSSKGAVTYGAESPVQLEPEKVGQTAPEETARAVKFYGTKNYGHVEALIGEETGHVYRVTYDSEPLLKLMKAQIPGDGMAAVREQIAKMKPGPERDRAEQAVAAEAKASTITEFTTTETYSHIQANPRMVIGLAEFDTTLPKGTIAMEMPAAPTEKPPVPIGKPAPDFEVSDMDGKPVRLSSLRGHVVLLDFWATWCPPCKRGLPDTAHLAKVGRASGLQVLAISSEAREPVTKFLKGQTYQLPAYLDAGSKAGAAYNTQAIPTVAIIDKEGNLSAYFVGLQERSTIENALAKAGATL